MQNDKLQTSESLDLVSSVKCGDYLNCLTWSPDCRSVYCGAKAGSVVKVSELS